MTTPIYPCLGALVGDTIGSVYEINNIKTTQFPLFSNCSSFTDDSVMTMAIADWLANTDRSEEQQIEMMVKWGTQYPDADYGGGFWHWLFCPKGQIDFNGNDSYHRAPYYSWGNGSAMRCSACGWAANTMEEAIALGRQSAIVSHNHPEGLRGAEATAAAIFLARQGAEKEQIRSFIEERFYYDLHMDCDEIRPKYGWEASCQGTVPPAIVSFLDSWDFESAIRLAISLGGDSDTLACITGGIAQAYYKEIPESIITEMRNRLPAQFWTVMEQLESKVNPLT